MIRDYFPGMGQAVADRTINRPGETWGDVARRVALGNAKLDHNRDDYESLKHHLERATTIMSGRHLQHGDATQPHRPMEVFSNCSTSLMRHHTFKLLLSGSGVGTCYDERLQIMDLTKMPQVVVVIDANHPDVLNGRIQGFLSDGPEGAVVFRVPDTREGWAKAIEQIEKETWLGNQDGVLVLDFSDVRPHGAPIRGMQNRPASGPGPLMNAIRNVASLRGGDMEPWEAAMWADHFLAECVLVGGARRAARIAIKHWKDPSIFKFINIKRPKEFAGLTKEQVLELRKSGKFWGQLWSANNSVAVDAEFYQALADRSTHAVAVWNAVMDAQYGDGTGEPAFLNVHKLAYDPTGVEIYREKLFASSVLYKPDIETEEMMFQLVDLVLSHPYQMIVNPCGEVALFLLGAFCIIADNVPFHATSDEEAIDSFRVVTRALMRVNLMPSIFNLEVLRTNRIGVGLTGIHEYMWKRFGLGFRDTIAHGPFGPLGVTEQALPFWEMLRRFGDAVDEEAESYAKELGVVVPHTNKTAKPSGSVSKLFGLTEGIHLPSRRRFLRWVQFRSDDPLVAQYAAKGYPFRQLETYEGTTIIGFPTAPVITTLGMGEKLVTASEATPEEQFRWLRLLEHYWLGTKDKGNQLSYTLKYDPQKVSFAEFEDTMRRNINTVRCVSVMPQEDVVSYEYQPEESISDAEYDRLMARIESMKEDVDRVHIDCSTGACPIHFVEKEAA